MIIGASVRMNGNRPFCGSIVPSVMSVEIRGSGIVENVGIGILGRGVSVRRVLNEGNYIKGLLAPSLFFNSIWKRVEGREYGIGNVYDWKGRDAN